MQDPIASARRRPSRARVTPSPVDPTKGRDPIPTSDRFGLVERPAAPVSSEAAATRTGKRSRPSHQGPETGALRPREGPLVLDLGPPDRGAAIQTTGDTARGNTMSDGDEIPPAGVSLGILEGGCRRRPRCRRCTMMMLAMMSFRIGGMGGRSALRRRSRF